jgi:hypothetical protein
MQTRLLPPGLALCALLADGIGLHHLAFWLVLLALPAAAAASFVGVSDGLAGVGWLAGATATPALLFLVAGSAVREAAARGSGVPAVAVTAVVGALLLYAVPAFAWVLEPLRPRPRARTTTARAHS